MFAAKEAKLIQPKLPGDVATVDSPGRANLDKITILDRKRANNIEIMISLIYLRFLL